MDGCNDVLPFYPPSCAELELAQTFDKRALYAAAYFTDLNRCADFAVYDWIDGKRDRHVPRGV